MLASCALGPKVPTPDVRLPAAFEAQPNAGPSTTPIDCWWTLYNDPQLESLVEQALLNAPDARTAGAQLKEALANRAEALSAFAPQGALQGSGSRVDTTVLKGPAPITLPGFGTISLSNAGVTNSYGANFDVSWEIDLFGRSFATRKGPTPTSPPLVSTMKRPAPASRPMSPTSCFRPEGWRSSWTTRVRPPASSTAFPISPKKGGVRLRRPIGR